MIASYLICYQNTNPLYFMRIRDICLKFIEIYDTLVVWFEAKKNIQYLCFILYDRTKPTRLMKYVATIVEKCSVEMETNVRFLCRFFSHVSKWWVYDNSLDICEILMNICNETWIVWEEVIRIDMCGICVCVCMCARHVCVYSKWLWQWLCEKVNNSSPTADCTGFINYLLLNVFSSFSVCESS